MTWLDRLIDWWSDMRNESANVGEEWSNSFPSIPEGMECPDTQPTSPGALDSDHARLE